MRLLEALASLRVRDGVEALFHVRFHHRHEREHLVRALDKLEHVVRDHGALALRGGFANALDIYGFEFDDGRVWTLIDHWEHDTSAPSTEAGRFLYESSRRWYDDWIWNIILTPNYNLAHDNHFHVDLKPDYHDISFTSSRYYGPALYND